MKKSTTSIFLLMLAFLTFQETVAKINNAVYGQTGEQPAEEVVLWDDPYMNNGGYTTEGTQNIWNVMDGILTAQAFNGENIESYYITPAIDLEKDNTIEIKHACNWFENNSKQLSLCVRETGGEWITIEGMQFGPEYEVTSSGVLKVPAEMNGKSVQFGLKYTAKDISTAGAWKVHSMIVKGVKQAKKPSALSFDVQELTYELGSDKLFIEPKLNNPDNLVVHYFSDNEGIADVDPESGKVTFNGSIGKVQITAIADETNEFDAARASYVINVIDPVKLFVAEFMYDECGFAEEEKLDIWKYSYGCMAAEYNKNVDEGKAAYLVSPEITLNANGNVVSFDFQFENMEKPEEITGIAIRETGKEWKTITIAEYPNGSNYKNTGEIAVPAEYNGKNVQFALVYKNTPKARWYVRNFVVALALDRAEAGISYDTTSFTYYIGSAEPFTAPKLNNPNNLEVVYTTPQNNGVVQVDSKTGEVKILREGVAIIVASTRQTNSFKAGEASYTLNVIDNTIVFNAPFGGSLDGFKEEGDGNYWSADGFANTSLWITPENPPVEGTKIYLVSPKITLGKSGNNVQWEQNGYLIYFEKQTRLAVRKPGGEWEEFAVEELAGTFGGWFKTKAINIPESYDAQEVELALVFISNGMECGWNVKNFIVRKAFEGILKDAGLAFTADSAEYDMSSEMLFLPPALINPNNLEVTYSSSNTEVATVDALTGDITFIDKGVTVIKAVSAETEEFLPGEASYTLTVTITPTGIETVIGGDLEKAEIYDLQGRRVYKPAKGVYIVNGRKVVIK